MKKTLLIAALLLISTNLVAQSINEKYSYKAFPYHGLSFKDRPVEEFNNTVIIGSCFYQEWREGDKEVVKDIFPKGIKGVVFKRCNLDNIYIPSGNIVIGEGEDRCCHNKIKVQNDLEDWMLNEKLQPVEPMDKEDFIELGLSINPKDIPKEKMEEGLVIKRRKELDEKAVSNPIN